MSKTECVKYDVAIVGGGASGLMAAQAAAKRGLSTILLEGQPRLGTKLLITGGGRCNVTNLKEPGDFLRFVRHNSRFLQSALNQFSPQDMIDFLVENGLPLMEETEGRIYPSSQKSEDVVRLLESVATSSGAKICYFHVKEIQFSEGYYLLQNDDGQKFMARSLILATGGQSYPKMGSIGEGYRFARQFGHTLSPLEPALVGMDIDFPWKNELMGISLENVSVTLKCQGKKKPIYQNTGDIIFTHFGLSGPLILEASSFMTGIPIEELTLYLSVIPKTLDEFQNFLKENQNREIATVLKSLLPARMVSTILTSAGINQNQKINQLKKDSRQRIENLLIDFLVQIKSLRPIQEAIVTAGGIKVKEINPTTMESKCKENLFIVGELLDVDALSGGYNLQIAFSTGVVAGNHILKERR